MAGGPAGRPDDGAGGRARCPTTSSAVEQALVENLHREDLTALEEAAAYLQLIEDFELTHDDVAQRVGKSRSAVTNTLRLLGLPPEVQHLLADGKLSAGHARRCSARPIGRCRSGSPTAPSSEGWSVRTVEDVVRAGGVVPAVAARRIGAPDRSRVDGGGHCRRRRDCARPVCSSWRSCSPTTSTPASACRWAPSGAR